MTELSGLFLAPAAGKFEVMEIMEVIALWEESISPKHTNIRATLKSSPISSR